MSTIWHDVKSLSCQKVCHDVNKFIIMSKVYHDVKIRRDVKKFVMPSMHSANVNDHQSTPIKHNVLVLIVYWLLCLLFGGPSKLARQ